MRLPITVIAPTLMYRKAIWIILTTVAVLAISNYLTGAVFRAFRPSNSDFSELYVSSRLWRQGQNPYDPMIATAARQRVVGGTGSIFLINVPTSLVLAAPFTFLPWGRANFFFLMLGMAGLGATIFGLLRLRQASSFGLETAALIVVVLSFSPLRIAFQWGNIVLLVLPLSILTVVLAESHYDWQAGVLLGLACCLKPQIGVWLGVYYLVRRRFKIVVSSLMTSLLVAALFLLHPIPYRTLVACYQTNMQHWFAPGQPYGFTEGSVAAVLLRTQSVFYPLTHSVPASNWMANTLFLGGVAVWGILMWRSGKRIRASLAIAALWSLSFLSMYHSIPDVSILTIALCDVFPSSLRDWTKIQKLTFALLFLMMLPARSIFVFVDRHLGGPIIQSWWWNLFFVRHFAWLLVALSFALLQRMREASREKDGKNHHVDLQGCESV